MAQIEVILPKMGESIAEATIIRWLKEEGETVELDEPIVEISLLNFMKLMIGGQYDKAPGRKSREKWRYDWS